jgi:hypothetical protein
MPFIADIGRSLFVVAIAPLHGNEPVPFVEAPGADVRLERPQLDASWPPLLSEDEKTRTDSHARPARRDVELIHPVFVENKYP